MIQSYVIFNFFIQPTKETIQLCIFIFFFYFYKKVNDNSTSLTQKKKKKKSTLKALKNLSFLRVTFAVCYGFSFFFSFFTQAELPYPLLLPTFFFTSACPTRLMSTVKSHQVDLKTQGTSSLNVLSHVPHTQQVRLTYKAHVRGGCNAPLTLKESI